MNNRCRTQAVRDCPICGHSACLRHWCVRDGYRVTRCLTCGCGAVDPQPTRETVLGIYSAEYFLRGRKYARSCDGTCPDDISNNDTKKVELLLKFMAQGKLLDIGCALGDFMTAAGKAGFDVHGLEVSEAASAEARKIFGERVTHADITAAEFPPASFDVLTMWDVIEHLADPHRALEKARMLLHIGGILALSTGNAASLWARLTGRFWPLLTPPQHLFFYTPKGLAQLLQRHGFVMTKVLHSPRTVKLGFLLLKAREAFGPVVTPLQTLVRSMGHEDTCLTINMHDVMTCIAVRTQ